MPGAAKRAVLRLLPLALMSLSLLPGVARAGFSQGASAYNAHNYALALREIAPLAQAGNADAQHLLGLMYYMGRGVPRDYRLAMQWHRKAAEQGKADAQYVIGAMYYTGNSVPQDNQQAIGWFRKAAAQGHGGAQYALGLMHRYHVAGVPHDLVLAYMLWNLAAAGGHPSAVAQRASLMRQMSAEQIEEGQALSRDWHVGQPLPTHSHLGGN